MPQYTVDAESRRSHEFAIIADTPDEAERKATTFARLIAKDPSAATDDVEVVILSVVPST